MQESGIWSLVRELRILYALQFDQKKKEKKKERKKEKKKAFIDWTMEGQT